jgi:DHA1 family multidrug resistance protein-like MFS transporter
VKKEQQSTAKILLSASLVIVMLGFGIALPLMSFYIIHFNASGSALGLMMSLYSLMQFLFAPMWGRLSDRIGRKPVLLTGIFGYFLAFVLQGLSQDIVQFTVSRTLAGILSSATLPTAMAYIADITEVEDRSTGVGLMGASMGLGMIFGPMLGGLLTGITLTLPGWLTPLLQVTTDPSTGKMINLSIPFFASALLALLAAPFIMIFLPESLHPGDRKAAPAAKRESKFSFVINGLKGPTGFLMAMAFLLAFALANMESVLSLYGGQHFSMGPSEVGMLMGGLGLVSVIEQGVVIGPLSRKFGETRIIQGGLLVGIAGFIGMALAATKPWLVVSALVFNMGNVLLAPSVTSLISKRTRDGQGAAMGMNNSFQALGRGIGPLWAGFAYDMTATLSFWTGALVQAIALVYAFKVFGSSFNTVPVESTETAD